MNSFADSRIPVPLLFSQIDECLPSLAGANQPVAHAGLAYDDWLTAKWRRGKLLAGGGWFLNKNIRASNHLIGKICSKVSSVSTFRFA